MVKSWQLVVFSTFFYFGATGLIFSQDHLSTRSDSEVDLYVGRTAEGPLESCGIELVFRDEIWVARPIDLDDPDTQYDRMKLGPAYLVGEDNQKKERIPDLWQGQYTASMDRGLGRALQLRVDQQGEPIAFAYASNIFPSAPKVVYRRAENNTWIVPDFVEIQCVDLQYVD